MNNFQRVFRNTSYLFISEILIKALGLFWVIFLARNLSVDKYGMYNVVVSFVAIFSFLPDLGVGIITIREIAKHKKRASKLLGEAFLLNVLLAVFTVIVAFASSYFLHIQMHFLVFISLIILFFSTIRSVSVFYFDGMEKMQYSAILNGFNSFLLIAFAVIALLLFNGSLTAVFFGMLVGTIISMSISYVVLYKHEKIHFTLDISRSLFLLKEGVPLGIASFAALVYSRVDVVMLSKFLGDAQAGIYSAATPFPMAAVQLLNVPFVVAVYPTLSRLHSEDIDRFKKGILKSVGVIALWSITASIITSLSAPIVIPLIFGEKYDLAIPVLQVLVFIVPFISLYALLYKVLIIIHKQKNYLIISISGAVMSICFNLILIPHLGLMGAAIAAVVTNAILFLIYFITVVFYVYKKSLHDVVKYFT